MNIEEQSPPRAMRKAGNHRSHFHDRGTSGGDHLDWQCIAVTGLRFLRRDLK